jgi:hypothetical protein
MTAEWKSYGPLARNAVQVGRRNSERQVRIKRAGTVCDHRAGPDHND